MSEKTVASPHIQWIHKIRKLVVALEVGELTSLLYNVSYAFSPLVPILGSLKYRR